MSLHRAKAIFDRTSPRDETSWSALLVAFTDSGQVLLAEQFLLKAPALCPLFCNLALKCFSRSGRLSRCDDLFRGMHHRDTVTWNTMITAYARTGHIESAKALFDASTSRSSITWNAMISALVSNSRMTEAKQVLDKSPHTSLQSWTTLVQGLSEHPLDFNVETLVDMVPCWDLSSVTAAVSAAMSQGRWAFALNLFDSALHHDQVLWSVLMAGFAQCERLRESRSLFEMMPERDLVCWNSLLGCYAHYGHSQEALDLFVSMPETDVVANSTMVTLYGELGQLNQAKRLFDSMRIRNVVSWTAMLLANAKNGHLQQAKQVFDRMASRNVVSFTGMIGSFGQNGAVAEACSTFDETPEKDMIVSNALIAAYACNSSGFNKAVGMVRLASLEGLALDRITFISLLTSCRNIGSVEQARAWFVLMQSDFSMKPFREHYLCMVDTFARAGNVGNAKELVENMPFLPDSAAWNILASASTTREATEQSVEQALVLDTSKSSPYVLLSTSYRRD